MVTYNAQIFLHHTDAAGRLFFARQFDLIHEAKEKLLESLGLPIQTVLAHPDVTFPLVHAESDYKSKLGCGDRIVVQASVEKLGETSVIFAFTILKADGQMAGTGKTVNVCVSKSTGQKCPLPMDWRHKLASALK